MFDFLKLQLQRFLAALTFTYRKDLQLILHVLSVWDQMNLLPLFFGIMKMRWVLLSQVYMNSTKIIIILFKNDKVINYDTLRGGISIETRRGDVTTSHLLIQHADETNSGRYSCSPSNAIVANIRVHVLNGKIKISKM